jgi:hypothetical protein
LRLISSAQSIPDPAQQLSSVVIPGQKEVGCRASLATFKVDSQAGVDLNAAAPAACLCHERLANTRRRNGFNRWLMRHSPLALAGNYPQHHALHRRAGGLAVQNLPTGK